MTKDKVILAIALTEILIGCVSLFSNILSLYLGGNIKTLNVFLFVTAAATVSLSLGLGLLNRRKAACQLLIYFSSVIILSKILIFAGIIRLDWTLEASMPAEWKNILSLIYHSFVILYLSRSEAGTYFRK